MSEHEHDILQAFLDESRKPVRDRRTSRVVQPPTFHYVVSAVVVFDDGADRLRHELLSLGDRLGFPLHYQAHGAAGRIEFARTLAQFDWEATVYETRRPAPDTRGPEHQQRAAALRTALSDLARLGVTKATLETRDTSDGHFASLDHRDHEVLGGLHRRRQLSAPISIVHRTKAEILLAIPDVIAGARTDSLCANGDTAWAHLCHRVEVCVVESGPKSAEAPGR